MTRILDLFAGIGGFSYAAHCLGVGETTQFVEINPYCQQVLAKNFPNIPIHADITTYHPLRGEFDLITFGSPCQDLSSAGKQKGIHGDRSGLFFHAVRIVKQVQPAGFIMENVAGLRKWQAEVLDELQTIGHYNLYWFSFSAKQLGACHQRERWFCIGWRNLTHPNKSPEELKIKQFKKFEHIKWSDDDEGFLVGYHGYPGDFINEFNYEYLENWLEEEDFIFDRIRCGNWAVNKFYRHWVDENNSIMKLKKLNELMGQLKVYPLFDDCDFSDWLCEKYDEYWEESGKDEMLEDVGTFIYQATGDYFSDVDIDGHLEKFILELWQEFFQHEDAYHDEWSTGNFYLHTDQFIEGYGKYILDYAEGDIEKIQLYYAAKNHNQYQLAFA